ncbi:MAG: RNA polymerase factor sigma-54 [Verrucomicrobia bacterium]|nr:RNA polymerase factor sigma-54 [Verrucomicrobiota bacterium]
MAQGLFLAQKMALAQTLAPQLQQSLILLQAPTMELKALVEQELQMNPVLEETVAAETHEEQTQDDSIREVDPAEPPADVSYDPATDRDKGPADDFEAEFERLSQMDQEWREHFSQTNLPLRQKEEEDEKRQFMFDSLVSTTSLQEHLIEQIRMSEIPEEKYPVAEMIVGNIDDNGYLQASVNELAFSTNIAAEEISSILEIIQTFHPPGVGARDLRECLLLQLERLERSDTLEYIIVRDYMQALGKRKFPEIAKQLSSRNDSEVTIEQVQDAAKRIVTLEPRPGSEFQTSEPQYIVPEVFVEKNGDEYEVIYDNQHFPHLRISNAYKDIMSKSDSSSEVRNYIRDKIRAGKFLIKSIHQRRDTILNIAREIVHRQREFLDHGISHLKPMTMLQVSEVVGVHETTVSRAVSGKYMQTPQGIFEMKFFFTSGIRTHDGNDVSNASIKDMINEFVRKEDKSKPLSDDAIVNLLAEQGIKIARRTVAKYRTELNILPSNMRKVY